MGRAAGKRPGTFAERNCQRFDGFVLVFMRPSFHGGLDNRCPSDDFFTRAESTSCANSVSYRIFGQFHSTKRLEDFLHGGRRRGRLWSRVAARPCPPFSVAAVP